MPRLTHRLTAVTVSNLRRRVCTLTVGPPAFGINGEGNAWHLAATRWMVSRARAPGFLDLVLCLKTAANSFDVASRITRFSPASLAAFPSLHRIARRCVVASFTGRPVFFYGICRNLPGIAFCWDGAWEHIGRSEPHPDQRTPTVRFGCGCRMRRADFERHVDRVRQLRLYTATTHIQGLQIYYATMSTSRLHYGI